jgi:hypothetical protein
MSEGLIIHLNNVEGAKNNISSLTEKIKNIRTKHLVESLDKFFGDQPLVEYEHYEDVYDDNSETDSSVEFSNTNPILESTVDQLLNDKLNEYRDQPGLVVANKKVPFKRQFKK